jgi:hypothetical protein
MKIFFPDRHLFVFFLFSLIISNVALSQTLRINELMAQNSAIIKDKDGEYSDWIEIYNPTSNPVNLTGWWLTDDKTEPKKWEFPEVTLQAQSYLLVFASGKNYRVSGQELHTNFKLSKSGEFLGLYDSGLTAVSIFDPLFPEQQENVSYAFSGSQYFNCLTPTPGTENQFTSQLVVYPPYFSAKHGFFTSSFKVGINVPQSDASIYYTTNGSEPGLTNGTLYSDSILIGTTSVLRAIAINPGGLKSSITSQTYLFINNVRAQSNSPAGYPATWGPYTAIPGDAIADYEMDQDVVQDPRYANDFNAAMLSIPTVSLVTDINNLFSKSTDPNTGGIYIYTGAPGDGEVPQLGDGWERPASVEYFNADGSMDFTINCGLRLHGGHSRRAEKTPKHSFRLAFRSEYGASKLNHPIFGQTANVAQSFNTIILRAGYGNTWLHMSPGERSKCQLIRDLWAKDLQLEIGNPAGHGNYVHLYLNGLYWGIYNPTERIDKNFGAEYLGGSEDDYDVIKDYGEVVDGNNVAWNEMMTLARQGMDNNDYYNRIQGKNPDGTPNSTYPAYVDLVNLIDYMILNFYGGNWDWDQHNWTALRNRVDPGKGFIFLSWDAEHIIETVSSNILNENNANCPSELFQRLLGNNKFRYLFAQRVDLLCFNNGLLTPEACQQRWMKRSNQIESAIIAESARWGDYRRDVHAISSPPYELYTKEHWLAQQQFIIQQYFPNRTNAFINELIGANLYPYNGPDVAVADVFNNPLNSRLDQNYPNPVLCNTSITYYISQSNFVKLTLHDALGKEIQVLVNAHQDKDSYTIPYDASNLPSGVYYYKLVVGNNLVKTRKMIVTRNAD